MKLRVLTISAMLMVAVVALAAAPSVSRSDMVVHEWGTFLAMNGSDGVALDGMYHEEHALPAFVHARSKDQLRLRSVTVKGETPVIYFYTDSRSRCRCRSDFPGGIWTQWYPQASTIGPIPGAGWLAAARRATATSAGARRRARRARPRHELPATSSDALWNYARDVDAAYVRSRDRTRPGAAVGMGAVHLLPRARRSAAAARRQRGRRRPHRLRSVAPRGRASHLRAASGSGPRRVSLPARA